MSFKHLLGGTLLFFAALPGTSTYQLNSYGFGSGGGSASTSTYSVEGTTGEVSGQTTSTPTYNVNPGFLNTEQANVPKISSFNNNGGIYYNKLHFVIDTQSNPTDTLYALSISTDDFASDVRYINTDMTVGTTLGSANFQTYAAWGGSGGANIIGLSYGTTYYLRATATQGTFTQSQFGPSSSAATASPSLTFNLTTSTLSSPPFSVSFGTLSAGNIGTSQQTIDIGLDTNAASGANIYLTSKNSGLNSASTSSSIASATANLGSVSSGYGAQSTSATQTSGGPFTAMSPYASSGNSVGVVDNLNRGLYTTTGPVSGGAGVLQLLARPASTTVAATDYTDILTFVAAGNF